MGLKQKAGCVIAAALTIVGSVGVRVAQAIPSAPASRYASIVLDADSGAVLYERNADLPRYPASLTKIMTLYLAFEALSAKKLALTDELTISAHAASRDPSRLDLAPGFKLKVEDAIRAMTTKSANDAACAIAEALAKGSEEHFAQAMTAKAKALGLTQTTFKNASGLPEEGHMTSARDLALLCKALIHNFPDYYSYFSTNAFEFHGVRYPNQNRFLRTYYGADGIKTGFVNASGHNLAASAVRGGKRLIAIVLGGDTQAWTREHATRLLDVSYAKIDPSLVMVASNSTGTPAAIDGAVRANGEKPVVIASAPVPAAVAYPTPGGAVTISSAPGTALPLPNATANLNAYVAAATAPNLPAGSVGPTTQPTTTIATVAAPAAHATTVPVPGPTREAATKLANTPKPSAPGNAGSTPSTAVAHVAAAPVVETHASSAPVAETAETHVAAAPKPVVSAPVEPEAAPKPASGAAASNAAAPVSETAGAPEAAGTSTVTKPATAPPANSGNWSVQVGLFRDATIARRRGEEARNQMPPQLRGADLVVDRAQDGVHVSSRLCRLSEQDARQACTALQRGQVPCVVVPPGRPLIVATN